MTEIFSIEKAPATAERNAFVAARIAQRYRSERLFRFFGLAAVAVTAAFVVILLTDILIRGIPAFTQHRLALDVAVPADVLPAGTEASTDVLRSVDFAKIVRESLRGAFPDVSERKRRKALDGLLSSGAGDELRRRVLADPSLIGGTVSLSAPLSADADLQLKSGSSGIERKLGTGTASLSGPAGKVSVTSTAEDFSAAAQLVRAAIERQKDRLATEVTRLEQLLPQTVGEERQGLDQKIADLKQRVASYGTRLSAAGGDIDLDSSTPTVLVALGDAWIKAERVTPRSIAGATLVPSSSTAPAAPGAWRMLVIETPESNRTTSDQEIAWLESLAAENRVSRHFNWQFFTSGDSREPELAGIRGALIGSILTLLVTLALCLPIGVAAAVYLEEFAPKNRLTDIIEVNINNLAAVPSIVFGLLGLAVFLNFFGLPRSAPLVGGLVLALLVLPTIIIASRAALKAVPPSIKEAALGVGASHQQAVFHHVLPLALPGIMTGTIIGMAHALGETAPLLMIGMVAFIVEVPDGLTSAATALPVQIYLWSDLPEVAFQSKTAAAIIVLLGVLFVMNGAAIYLRRRFERRW